MSSGSGGATSGRPPQLGRNSIPSPGFNDIDLRVSREIPIHDSMKLQFNAEAFNLLNHRIITGVNSTYSNFLAPGASATGANVYKCPAAATVTVPAGSRDSGCFVPYVGTGLSQFGTPSSTSSSSLYGSRQLQVSAKLFF